ncbi:unnamed protein product [Periconia digitata]|uniref:Uncharacterized protein n=1 Tax=Periconia digitata TaxID=1303443 RepID=A0A9W4UGC3_9PLEO|nr:unnamed protein product [Periconia digitata]
MDSFLDDVAQDEDGFLKTVIPMLRRPHLALKHFFKHIRHYAKRDRDLLMERLKLYDIDDSWTPASGTTPNFVQVYDIPLSTGKPGKPYLNHGVEEIPVQTEHTIRIYFEVESERPYRLDQPLSTSITSQWGRLLGPTQQTYWEIESYHFSLKPMLSGFTYGIYIDSLAITARTIRKTFRCRFHSTGDDRVLWHIKTNIMEPDIHILFGLERLIRYDIETPSERDACEPWNKFCDRLRALMENHSSIFTQLDSLKGRKQFLLLLYSQVLVEDYCRQVYLLQEYARRKEALSDPRRTKLTTSMLKEISRDSCLYEEVHEMLDKLSGAVDTLVEALKLQVMDTADSCELQSLAVDLKSTCTDLRRITDTFLVTLERRLRLFELLRGMHEAQKVRYLGILASIFLPLSLASGLLSMQTRFADLGYLIYDFFGVLVLIGSIVIILLLMLKFYVRGKELWMQFNRDFDFRWFLGSAGFVMRVFVIVATWAVLLSSFSIGMLKNTELGLKILGYGVATVVGIGPAFLLLHFLISLLCRYSLQAGAWVILHVAK